MAGATAFAPAVCTADGCAYLSWASGLCCQHYWDAPRGCQAEGCTRPSQARRLCHAHYQAQQRQQAKARAEARVEQNLRRAAAYADARMWLDQVWSAALLASEDAYAR